MNVRIIFALLGTVAIIFGASMFLCLPWGLPSFGGSFDAAEHRGIVGLFVSGAGTVLLGLILMYFGRGADRSRLFRKEAIAIVAFSWILLILIGAAPYLCSGTQRAPGVPMTFCDALFESASGLTTTGATVFGELEDPSLLPRSILFWRSMTHFFGGLGVMCFFVTLLGQGASGKSILKQERSASGSLPVAKMRTVAFYLFLIYVSLTFACFVLLTIFGMTSFDATAHAFSAIALGGFSTHNASVGFFETNLGTNGLGIECVLIFFMLVAGTNYGLIYWTILRKPSKLLHDSEWRLYIAIVIIGVAVTTVSGILNGDFRSNPCEEETLAQARCYDPLDARLVSDGSNSQELVRTPGQTICETAPKASFGNALRRATFQTVSLATGAGFATDRYELWNSTSLTVLFVLMVVGGCAGSTAGGLKVFRILLANKSLYLNFAQTFSPNVVRATRLDGENVDKSVLHSAVTYIFVFGLLVFATAALVTAIEPDLIWIERGESQVEKMSDLFLATASMYANVGPAFGAFGSFGNYGELSEPTKFILSWATLLGRLEIWTVLALLSPNFWRDR